MAIYTDQVGKQCMLDAAPARIISLVPSQTELLYDLGLDEAVIGITQFCVHPAHWFSNKKRIGGTKSVHLAQVVALEPDLIIANKEENQQEQVAVLAAQFPVWTSNISNLPEALQMIEAIGTITGSAAKAAQMITVISQHFEQLTVSHLPIRVTYLIWQNPYMTIGGDTFIHDMLTRCGFRNIFKDRQRYPTITIEDIRNNHCQLLLLSSEPFPFKQSHLAALQKQLPSTKILLVNGEMFSWYGSRLLLAPGYFASLIKEIANG